MVVKKPKEKAATPKRKTVAKPKAGAKTKPKTVSKAKPKVAVKRKAAVKRKTPVKRGAPVFKPTNDERKLVEQMSAVGIPHESIALVVRDGIDDKTLRKHFRAELDTAKIRADAVVSGSLFKKCKAGDTTAIIWWEKTRQGRKETRVQENTGKDGGPIETIDYSKLSDEAIKELMAARNDPSKSQ